jgi:hypothetical protein
MLEIIEIIIYLLFFRLLIDLAEIILKAFLKSVYYFYLTLAEFKEVFKVISDKN